MGRFVAGGSVTGGFVTGGFVGGIVGGSVAGGSVTGGSVGGSVAGVSIAEKGSMLHGGSSDKHGSGIQVELSNRWHSSDALTPTMPSPT